jgi:hypothetical protein
MTAWVFQANPKRYDLLAAARNRFSADWSMNQHRRLVGVGDGIYFYLSGKKAGIYAVGHVVSPVYEIGEADQFGKWKVQIEYDALVEPPLLRVELLADPILSELRVFHGVLATNFLVPDHVAARLDSRLIDRLSPLVGDTSTNSVPPQPSALEMAVAEHQAEIKRALLERLHEISPRAFEELIHELLERLGFEDAELRGGSGDQGIDVVATLRLHGMTSVPTVIQAKRWRNPVPGKVVRQLRGALKVDERGVVITTSSFTKDAIAEAQAVGKSPIGLVGGADLVDLMTDTGLGVKKQPLSSWTLDLQALDPDDAE